MKVKMTNKIKKRILRIKKNQDVHKFQYLTAPNHQLANNQLNPLPRPYRNLVELWIIKKENKIVNFAKNINGNIFANRKIVPTSQNERYS